ncbi:HTH-type transcriptional regulator CysB [compost metagenome]
MLEAIDADVIKTYVEIGLGVGIVAGVAYDAERDRNLRGISAGHLFGSNVTHLAVKQGAYLRSFVYTFIELFSPTLNRKLVEQAMSGEHEAYEL